MQTCVTVRKRRSWKKKEKQKHYPSPFISFTKRFCVFKYKYNAWPEYYLYAFKNDMDVNINHSQRNLCYFMKIFLNCVTGIIFKINLQCFMNEGSFGLLLTITLILIESEILTGINFFQNTCPGRTQRLKFIVSVVVVCIKTSSFFIAYPK